MGEPDPQSCSEDYDVGCDDDTDDGDDNADDGNYDDGNDDDGNDDDGNDDDYDDDNTDDDAYPYDTGKNKSFYFQCFWVPSISLCDCQDWSI